MSTIDLELQCICCGSNNDRAHVDGEDENRRPTVGELSICLHCGFVGIFDTSENSEAITVRLPTKIEQGLIDQVPGVIIAQHMIANGEFK